MGIVTQDWCDRFGIGDPGMRFPLIKHVAFAKESELWTSVHELGHTYGFGEGYYSVGPYFFNGELAQSLWNPWPSKVNAVAEDDPRFMPLDYMGVAGYGKYWTTKVHFAELFRKFTAPVIDPETILVTGTIDRYGEVKLGFMDRLVEGVADEPPAGDASINVLDGNGNVLSVTPFALDFIVNIEPQGAVEMDFVPFAFAVPYPPTAAQVQVVQAGQVLATINVTTKLLHDAVASIPDSGFTQNASQRRNALFNKINALEKQISVGASTGARNHLLNDIRKDLVNWLVNGYLTESVLEYTKDEVLDLVDDLLQRLGS